MRSLSFIVVLAILVAAISAVRADIITLRDGSTQEGEIIKESAFSVTLRVRVGGNSGTVNIPRREIVSIKAQSIPLDPVLVEGINLQKKADSAGTDAQKAEAWVKVGEYYRQHEGFQTLSNAAFTKALIFDPNQAVARARLGFEKTAAGWMERPRPAIKEEVPAAVVEKAAAPENDLVIGLRKDQQVIQNIIDKQAERKRQDAMPPMQQQWIDQRDQMTYYGYSRDYYYIGPDGVAYYVPYGFAFGAAGGYDNGLFFQPFGCGYGSSGHGHHGGYGYSGTGLSVGFRGTVGNVHVSGSLNSSSNFSSSTGFFGGGGGFRGGRSGF